jgi:hypothetical protein
VVFSDCCRSIHQFNILGTWCFDGCRSLTSVRFEPNSNLTRIDSFDFSGCSTLNSICIPSSVEVIAHRCFETCTSLESVRFESFIPDSFPVKDNYRICLYDGVHRSLCMFWNALWDDWGIVLVNRRILWTKVQPRVRVTNVRAVIIYIYIWMTLILCKRFMEWTLTYRGAESLGAAPSQPSVPLICLIINSFHWSFMHHLWAIYLPIRFSSKSDQHRRSSINAPWKRIIRKYPETMKPPKYENFIIDVRR